MCEIFPYKQFSANLENNRRYISPITYIRHPYRMTVIASRGTTFWKQPIRGTCSIHCHVIHITALNDYRVTSLFIRQTLKMFAPQLFFLHYSQSAIRWVLSTLLMPPLGRNYLCHCVAGYRFLDWIRNLVLKNLYICTSILVSYYHI